MRMTLHLDGDSFNCQYSYQSNIAVRQFCKHLAEILSLKTVYNLVSSANNLIVTPAGDRVQISLTYNINNKGDQACCLGGLYVEFKAKNYI